MVQKKVNTSDAWIELIPTNATLDNSNVIVANGNRILSESELCYVKTINSFSKLIFSYSTIVKIVLR